MCWVGPAGPRGVRGGPAGTGTGTGTDTGTGTGTGTATHAHAQAKPHAPRPPGLCLRVYVVGVGGPPKPPAISYFRVYVSTFLHVYVSRCLRVYVSTWRRGPPATTTPLSSVYVSTWLPVYLYMRCVPPHLTFIININKF